MLGVYKRKAPSVRLNSQRLKHLNNLRGIFLKLILFTPNNQNENEKSYSSWKHLVLRGPQVLPGVSSI
jgi:hypothetical protein